MGTTCLAKASLELGSDRQGRENWVQMPFVYVYKFLGIS